MWDIVWVSPQGHRSVYVSRPLASRKLYCWVTKAYVWRRYPESLHDREYRKSNPRARVISL